MSERVRERERERWRSTPACDLLIEQPPLKGVAAIECQCVVGAGHEGSDSLPERDCRRDGSANAFARGSARRGGEQSVQ